MLEKFISRSEKKTNFEDFVCLTTPLLVVLTFHFTLNNLLFMNVTIPVNVIRSHEFFSRRSR